MAVEREDILGLENIKLEVSEGIRDRLNIVCFLLLMIVAIQLDVWGWVDNTFYR